MTIMLNHLIVPAHDKEAAASFFADTFGVEHESGHGPFAAVRVNNGLVLLFDTWEKVERQHYAFHVSETEFDQIFGRVKQAGLAWGSHPWSAKNGQLNDHGGGRGVYFESPDGHLLELMTVPQ